MVYALPRQVRIRPYRYGTPPVALNCLPTENAVGEYGPLHGPPIANILPQVAMPHQLLIVRLIARSTSGMLIHAKRYWPTLCIEAAYGLSHGHPMAHVSFPRVRT